MITMNDKKVLDERGEKYGPTKPMWETIRTIQWEQFKFLLQKCGVRKPTREELGQLAALNMTVVKFVAEVITGSPWARSPTERYATDWDSINPIG